MEVDIAQKPRKVDVRLPGKGNSNSHGARPVHLIITMIKWIQTSRLSIKNSLSLLAPPVKTEPRGSVNHFTLGADNLANNYFAEM